MSDIYDQHKAAFSQVSAFVIMKNGDKIATVALKFPKDGAGRLTAYVHWLGCEMTRGNASGFGYDKGSAAVADAARKITRSEQKDGWNEESQNAFIDACMKDDGWRWCRRLEDAGFDVLQAV